MIRPWATGQESGRLGPAVFGPMALPLAIVGTVLSVGGQIMSAVQGSEAADAQAKAMQAKADAERRAGIQEQAQAQQRQIAQNRRTAYALSAARAGAAASGAGAEDPSVVTNEGNIGAQGQYNADSALYVGNVRAAGLQTQAGLDDFQASQMKAAGQSKLIGGIAGAVGSAVSSGSSLYDKYGPMSPLDTNVSPDIYQANLTSRYGTAYKATI